MLAVPLTRRLGNVIGFVICAALIGYALYLQHVGGLEPCPLCIFQRVAVIVVGALFLIAALHHPGRTGARVYALLLVAAALLGTAVSGRHIWIQAQPPGTVAACGADLNYLLDIMPVTEVITKVLTGSGECGTVDWSLLGLSMPWWVAFALAGLAGFAVLVNVLSRVK